MKKDISVSALLDGLYLMQIGTKQAKW